MESLGTKSYKNVEFLLNVGVGTIHHNMVATKYSRQRLSGLNRGNEPREWFYDRRAALHPRVFSTFPTCVIVTIRNTYVNERRRAKTPRPSCGFSLQGANQRHLGLLTLDILGDDVMSRGLLAPVPNSDGRAPHDLPRVTLRVELAEAGPFAELVVVIHFDEWDAVLLAEGLDELLVCRFVAVFGQHAQMSLAFVKSLKTEEYVSTPARGRKMQLQYKSRDRPKPKF